MNNILISVLLLVFSNAFMTFAWYGHLKIFLNKPLIFVIIFSWLIAFFEYLLQIPAIRIAYNEANLSLGQLKIIQEVVSLTVFVPFALIYMDQKMTINYLWAGLCIMGAVYFIFKTT